MFNGVVETDRQTASVILISGLFAQCPSLYEGCCVLCCTHLAFWTDAGSGKRARDVRYYTGRHVFHKHMHKMFYTVSPILDKIIQLISGVCQTWCFTKYIVFARNEI
jgi:hypothetical protein